MSKCDHGKRMAQCIDCCGTSICEHKKEDQPVKNVVEHLYVNTENKNYHVNNVEVVTSYANI